MTAYKSLDGSGNDGGGYNPPGTTTPPATNIGAKSSQLITSTGGLFGINSVLLFPYYNADNGHFYMAQLSVDDFNTEEDCAYDFREEEAPGFKSVTIHKVIIQLRDLGKVKFQVWVSVYIPPCDCTSDNVDEYVLSEVKEIKWGYQKNYVPDYKLHELNVDIVINGRRPQLHIFRKANAGPFSLISAGMFGTIQEDAKI